MSEGARRRGPYAKGIAKRREILHEGLLAYAESGSAGPSLRSVAARVGLSDRGLLHYFPSREQLFVAILRERDAAAVEAIGVDTRVETFIEVQARNARTPGLTRLFFEMAAASPDPASPAHAFFTGRYLYLRTFMNRVLRRPGSRKTSTRISPDSEFLGRILIAASDGLQLQCLLDPTIDMESDLKRLAAALFVTADDTSPSDESHPDRP